MPVDPRIPMPPTHDELPYEDGEPMDSPWHRAQMNLLIETLQRWFSGRTDVYVSGHMAVYYSVIQARNQDFRAPDFFVVLGAAPDWGRKSWVVWEEGGKVPDLVIELLSESTEAEDRGRKKQVYEGLHVSEYFLYDPGAPEVEGFRLSGAAYTPLAAAPVLHSAVLGLDLVVVEGTYQTMHRAWLRWRTPDGVIVPTGEELARGAASRAESAESRAESAETEVARLAARLRALGFDPDGG